MREGDFSTRVPVESSDEIGALSLSFNLMAEAVEQHAERLEATAESLAQRRNELRNRGVGFIFQFYHLVNELTAIENVMLPAMIGSSVFGWLGKRGTARERAESLLGEVGLESVDQHFSAFLEALFRDGFADAGCRAGDDDRFVFETHVKKWRADRDVDRA